MGARRASCAASCAPSPIVGVLLAQVAEFVDRAVNIAVDLKKKFPKLKEFREALAKQVSHSASSRCRRRGRAEGVRSCATFVMSGTFVMPGVCLADLETRHCPGDRF
jgi:hypothetical protein